jgi:transcriptional regulator with XRE-family HTH domain
LQDTFHTAPPLDAMPHVGRAIRALRQGKGMTLQELATAAGVSVGMLSQIERDRANPSLRILSQLRTALGAPISALFEEPRAVPQDAAFVRRANSRPWLDLGYLRKELLSPGGPQSLKFMILHIPPFGSSDKPMSYPAEKGGLVLEGELVLTVGGTEARLAEGDSFLFSSMDLHAFRNPLDSPARVLWIMGPMPADGL